MIVRAKYLPDSESLGSQQVSQIVSDVLIAHTRTFDDFVQTVVIGKGNAEANDNAVSFAKRVSRLFCNRDVV